MGSDLIAQDGAAATEVSITGSNGITATGANVALDNHFNVSDTATLVTAGDENGGSYVQLTPENALVCFQKSETNQSAILLGEGTVQAGVMSETTTLTNLIEPVIAGDNITVAREGTQYKISAGAGEPDVKIVRITTADIPDDQRVFAYIESLYPNYDIYAVRDFLKHNSDGSADIGNLNTNQLVITQTSGSSDIVAGTETHRTVTAAVRNPTKVWLTVNYGDNSYTADSAVTQVFLPTDISFTYTAEGLNSVYVMFPAVIGIGDSTKSYIQGSFVGRTTVTKSATATDGTVKLLTFNIHGTNSDNTVTLNDAFDVMLTKKTS